MSIFSNMAKKKLPLVYVRDAVIFPDTFLELHFRDDMLIRTAKDMKVNDEIIAVANLAIGREKIQKEDLEKIGTVGRVLSVQELFGEVAVQFEGRSRAKVLNFAKESPFFEVETELFTEDDRLDEQGEDLRIKLFALTKQIINTSSFFNFEMALRLLSIQEPRKLINNIMAMIDEDLHAKQDILETKQLKSQIEKTITLLEKKLQKIDIEEKVAKKTQEEISKSQKEVFLREELKAIQEELGESDGNEYESTKRKIQEASMPAEVESIALRELSHLEKMPSFSPEISYIRNYLDWLTAMPWNRFSDSHIDIKEARRILNKDHYGLENVKERILEYLAVQKLIGKIKGPILCFAGPPGTGKTSIGRSIAKALGRKFIRMSLGGIRDEAEIRGHRRTYVGAMPGRILQGIREVGVRNPVFMLDEIDKVGTDYRGDPSSALLEALDPEQNKDFSDHYLEAPFDLSGVLFITTANILDTIPPSLRDRMEIIEFSGYTEDEKLEIAKNYILPKIRQSHGLEDKNFFIVDDAIKEIIIRYTKEAGVRSLERELSKVARKIALEIALQSTKDHNVKKRDIPHFLGQPRIDEWIKSSKNYIGMIAALAVTEAGGEVLSVESMVIPGGKGNLTLTGNLGEVMKESALAALSYAKLKAQRFGKDPNTLSSLDVHVHVPRGSIPKDGPSAGVAMVVSILSALIGKPVNADIGVTGEITLQGHVLRIGGLKEKILAARQANLRKVILPLANEGDLVEISPELTKGLEIRFIENVDEALSTVFQQ